MTRAPRHARWAPLVAVVAVATAACGSGGSLAADPRDRVRTALGATTGRPLAVTYRVTSAGRDIEVRLRSKDAFRYHAVVAIDGVPVVEEAVVDDTIAMRLLDPSAPTWFPGATLPPPLASGAWVVDEVGAPDPLAPQSTVLPPAEKAVDDALAVFAAARAWLEEADEVSRFNPNAVDYRAKEDPFPVPPSGSPVIRYDGKPPSLPQPDDGGAQAAVPSENHFRRVAFYVKDGALLAVRSSVDVQSRLVDIERVYGFDLPDDRPPDEVADAALRAVNRIRVGQGNEPVTPGRWDVAVEPLPADFDVAVPQGAVAAPLRAVLAGPPKEVSP